jgi:glycosyltransferase involved in cell wall biosynthesis
MQIVRKYQNFIDKIICETDTGIYNAMNKGLKNATGQYVAFLNANDWYEDGIIPKIIEKIQNSDYDVYHGLIRLWNRSVIYQVVGATIDMMPECMPAHPSCFIRRELYLKYLFDERYKSAADYDFMAKISNESSFCFIEEIIANFELGGISSSILSLKETLQIQYRHKYISKIKYIVSVIMLNISALVSKIQNSFNRVL